MAVGSGYFRSSTDGLADPDGHADLDRRRADDLGAVEVGAVRGAHVLDEPLAVAGEHPRVPAGDVVVVEHDRRVLRATHRDCGFAEPDARAG